MSKCLKYIVVKEDNDYVLRLSYVYVHAELLFKYESSTDCLGGGFWEVDEINKKIKLFGKSLDFGKVPQNILSSAINNYNIKNIETLYNKIIVKRNNYIDMSDYKIEII